MPIRDDIAAGAFEGEQPAGRGHFRIHRDVHPAEIPGEVGFGLTLTIFYQKDGRTLHRDTYYIESTDFVPLRPMPSPPSKGETDVSRKVSL